MRLSWGQWAARWVGNLTLPSLPRSEAALQIAAAKQPDGGHPSRGNQAKPGQAPCQAPDIRRHHGQNFARTKNGSKLVAIVAGDSCGRVHGLHHLQLGRHALHIVDGTAPLRRPLGSRTAVSPDVIGVPAAHAPPPRPSRSAAPAASLTHTDTASCAYTEVRCGWLGGTLPNRRASRAGKALCRQISRPRSPSAPHHSPRRN